MADKTTNVQGPAASGATETKDELINGVLVNTGEIGDGTLDQVAGGLKIKLQEVRVSSYQLGGSHGDDTPSEG
jgi:hypothetical protein